MSFYSKLYHSALDYLTDKGVWISSKELWQWTHDVLDLLPHLYLYSTPFWDQHNQASTMFPIHINRISDSVQLVVYRLAYFTWNKHNIQNIATVKSVHFPLPLTKRICGKVLNSLNLHKHTKLFTPFSL